MRLDTIHSLIIVAMVALATQITRWTPFLLFSGDKKLPKVVEDLGRLLPPAMMGLLLAFGVMHPNAVIMLLIPPIPMKAKWFVIIYAVIELFLGWRGVGNVAHFAHVGGMLWGFLLLHWWKRRGTIRF